jgi:hypothetical protein
VFIYTPVLLIGLVAAVVAAFRRSDSLRWEAVAVVLTVLVGWGWVLLFGSPNFGGTSYGFRYSIPAAPLLIFFCYMIFRNGTAPILQTVFRNAVVWGMLIALIAIPGPWGMFSQALPKTDNSVVENLENIVAGLLFRGG